MATGLARGYTRQWIHKNLRLSCEIGAIIAVIVGVYYAFWASERRPDLFFAWAGTAACLFLVGWVATKFLDWQDYRQRQRKGIE